MAEDDSVSDGSAVYAAGVGGDFHPGGQRRGVRRGGFLLSLGAGHGAGCPACCGPCPCPPGLGCLGPGCPVAAAQVVALSSSSQCDDCADCEAGCCPALPGLPPPLYRSRSLPQLLHSDSHSDDKFGDKFDSGVACSNSYSGAEHEDLDAAAARSARPYRRQA